MGAAEAPGEAGWSLRAPHSVNKVGYTRRCQGWGPQRRLGRCTPGVFRIRNRGSGPWPPVLSPGPSGLCISSLQEVTSLRSLYPQNHRRFQLGVISAQTSSHAIDERMHKKRKGYREELRRLCGARSSDTHCLQRRIHLRVSSHEGNPESDRRLGPEHGASPSWPLSTSSPRPLAPGQAPVDPLWAQVHPDTSPHVALSAPLTPAKSKSSQQSRHRGNLLNIQKAT